MIVDELILKLQADLSDVKKKLAEVEKDAGKAGKAAGESMGKQAGTSFGDVFNAIAGAAVLNTVKGFFSKAAAEFNKMEAAFLRVDSIAKGFGRSVEGARKQVSELADKGFLNLNQSASSFADAIALGFDEKQARKFIDSLSDIAAFQNTIGDGAAAVQSGLAGLLSNSAEKVENIGVPVKVLNMEYQKNIQTMGKAAAMQKFYNGILLESTKFQGDAAKSVDTLAGAQNKATAATEKAMVAIGKGLEPALKSFYRTVQTTAESFAKWFGGLNEGTKSILLFGAALVAIVPAVSAVGKAFLALSINPVVLAMTALLAVGVGVAAVLNQINNATPKDIAKSYRDQKKELQDLGDKVQALNSINKRTISQELELVDSKERLRKKAAELGLDYDKLAAKAKNYAEVLERISMGARDKAAADIDERRLGITRNQRATEQLIRIAEQSTGRSISELAASGATNISTTSGVLNARQLLLDRERYANQQSAAMLERASLYSEVDETGKPVAGAGGGGGKAAVEQRFAEAQKKLQEIEKNRLFTIATISKNLSKEEQERQRQNAEKDAEYQRKALRGTFQQVFAEYIEDKLAADQLALSEQTRQAKRASEEQLSYELSLAGKNEKIIQEAKENNRKRLAKIDEANAQKQGKIQLEAFASAMQAAQATTTGISQIATAKDTGSAIAGAGNTLTGVSKFSPKLAALAPYGMALAAGGAIFGLLSGLFGKSDEQRAAEAQQQARRDEEARAQRERMLQYDAKLLALQEAAAKVPFENLQRDLRLIEIQAQKERLAGVPEETVKLNRLTSRQAAIQNVLKTQAGKISENALFAGTGSTPEDLTTFVKTYAQQALAVAQFQELIKSAPTILSQSTFTGGSAAVSEILRQAQTYSGLIPPQIYQAGINGLSGLIQNIAAMEADYNMRMAQWQADPNKEKGNLLFGAGVNLTNARTAGVNATTNISSGVNRLASEFTTDLATADSLLSVAEQGLETQREIAEASKKTADNTAKALELRPDRERSFIDIGLGFIQSLGQKITTPTAVSIAQNLASQNFTVPTEIGTATLTASRARTLQERMADALEKQVSLGMTANDILRDMRAALIELIAVTDGNPSTSGSFTLSQFTELQAEANRRRV